MQHSSVRFVVVVCLAIVTMGLFANSVAGIDLLFQQERYSPFRESFTPSMGGKIPDGALHPQRLLLNRLNQNGLFAVDGVYFDQRSATRSGGVAPRRQRTLQVLPPPDGRFTAPPGRPMPQEPVTTTYAVREAAAGASVRPPPRVRSPPPPPTASLVLAHKFRIAKGKRARPGAHHPPHGLSAQVLASLAPLLRELDAKSE